MTPLITILVGVAVFVISQYFLRLVLDPITRVRRAIADVSSTVLFRQAKISNATHHLETSNELRRAVLGRPSREARTAVRLIA